MSKKIRKYRKDGAFAKGESWRWWLEGCPIEFRSERKEVEAKKVRGKKPHKHKPQELHSAKYDYEVCSMKLTDGI